MQKRGLQRADSIAPEGDDDARAFVDSICGPASDWNSVLTSYRLTDPFQGDWKAEVGHWLLFARRAGFLPQVEHLLVARVKPYTATALPNGKPDPNDPGHAILGQVLAPVEVAYYLAQNGWSFVEWEPAVPVGDIDLRMRARSGETVDIQVKASDVPGRVEGYRRYDGEIDEHVQAGMRKAVEQISSAPGPARVVVATPQRTWPMSRHPSPIASLMVGSTRGYEGGIVVLEEGRRGLFASAVGAKVSAAVVLDLIRGVDDKFYGCTVYLNPWAIQPGKLSETDFPAAAVCELRGGIFAWQGSPGECYVLPNGTRYETGTHQT